MQKFNQLLIIGDPSCLSASLKKLSQEWLAIAKDNELASSVIPLNNALSLTFPKQFNINEYLDQESHIYSWLDDQIEKNGLFDRVIAPTEYTIEIGSKIRDKYNVPGWKSSESARIRDKGVMKTLISKGGIPTPAFLDLAKATQQEIKNWIGQHSNTIVLKPKRQAASRGIEVYKDKQKLINKLSNITQEILNDYIIEEYIDWPIIHIDGLVRDGKLEFVVGSYYLDTCLEWLNDKKAMGSVLITDLEWAKIITEFTTQVVSALELKDFVFHLEAFSKQKELQFLEIAGRPGGAGIVPHLDKLFGINLQNEMILCDLGLPKQSHARGYLDANDSLPNGGWIVTPLPSNKPYRVTGMKGLDKLPEQIYHAQIPALGHVFNQHEDEGLPSGKFFVKANSQNETEALLKKIANTYELIGIEE